jgi:alkyl sulfatase BDS1-like metallo-beta-lactamase superfamily hydrolase
MSRPTLTSMLTDPASIPTALEDGSLVIDGDAGALGRLFAVLDQPAPGFNIVEP